MLHFAYGSNMHRAVMRRHAPAAEPVGVARLADFRFVITIDGYASIKPLRAGTVHGVLWRLTPRDRATLDIWENIAGGLYRAETLAVDHAGARRPALVYIARLRRAGRPKPGYMEIVVAAAREWEMPPPYIASLQAWLPRHPLGAGHRKLGDFG
ncbi:MAG: gamma-glutamylcyclotransferase family protein [Xanthobacteraceae bacterium]